MHSIFSDGTIRFLCILVAIFQAKRLECCYDEPELGSAPGSGSSAEGCSTPQSSECSWCHDHQSPMLAITVHARRCDYCRSNATSLLRFQTVGWKRLTKWLRITSLGEIWQKSLMDAEVSIHRGGTDELIDFLTVCEGHSEKHFCNQVCVPLSNPRGVILQGSWCKPNRKLPGIAGWARYQPTLKRIAQRQINESEYVWKCWSTTTECHLGWPGRRTARRSDTENSVVSTGEEF